MALVKLFEKLQMNGKQHLKDVSIPVVLNFFIGNIKTPKVNLCFVKNDKVVNTLKKLDG